ncbi:Thiamine biosynthesis lipoprotein ApbE precursor [Aedoeadaptatus ivorii]|uniref:FAD:protein FMN transferase n=1 Tax=Aedoeadaptatus ivorii TaxID=54006 RepID=A0A3S4YUW1_9FIRM|nr:FAD:protein FMN transferase [Peptoniphilus ivorii]MDQ0508989.1 thiamine biosynthesis lipoprotein [Peptoniphilus ivorii]VEJ35034.1 Thiamine biosynthesis lipoprotein ApbE precursor [Peptoniphilus ivorii]
MRKKWTALLLALAMLMTACGGIKRTPERYEITFYDTFDTLVTAIVYADSKAEGDKYTELLHKRFQALHRIYDGFNRYENVSNLKALNDAAGKGKFSVEPELMDLLSLSIERYKEYGETNIAFGAVTDIWKTYRDRYTTEKGHDHDREKNAELPPMDALRQAAAHTNIDDIVLYPEENAVEIKDPDLSIDLGAVAKGYATEVACRELEEAGCKAALVSAGGNVKLIGSAPEPNRTAFGIGLQDPDAITEKRPTAQNMKDVVYANNTSVVTSGDYQRYYTVDGKNYHHLIDPDTLMPADHFRAVSVISEDSGLADFLSTTVFCMPYEEGRKLVDSLDGVEAYWILKDGSIEFTESLRDKLKSEGASNAK